MALFSLLAGSAAAQIKKVLVTDFVYGSLHPVGRPLCLDLIKALGTEMGYTVEVAATEGKITADYLKGFDLAVWNSMSQNGLQSAAAKAAWQAWIEGGGAVLSLHASGDTRTGTWTWLMEGVMDAKYEGHSDVVPADVWIHTGAIAANGQFHPILKNQDKYFKQYAIAGEAQKRWAQPWADEWYKYTKNPDPQGKDLTVLLELDEFNKRGVTSWDPAIAKTGYHPMAWSRGNIGTGKGRLVWICTGHDDKIMAAKDKGLKELWKNAMLWATKNSAGCKTPSASNYNEWADKEDGTCVTTALGVPGAGTPGSSGTRGTNG
ncbi:MAG: glucose dehydrogenase [Fibrobacteres bacterium]|nr:glucose dehydrogenase [Fibrobacterota bacterium]